MREMVRRLLLAFALTALLSDVAAAAPGIGRPQLGPTTTQQAVDQITRSVTRPVPAVPPPPVVTPPGSIWVPEHFTLGDVKVPGHWQQRLPDGSVYVPPLIIFDPREGERLIPGHVEPRPWPDQTP